MSRKKEMPNLRSEKLIWVISGLYLLAMVWLVLSAMGYGTIESRLWLMPAVVAFTASFGILMLWLWPHEKVS
jgi:hypothetical protein